MAPFKTAWTRLIRFVAVETGMVHLGQPVDPDLDVGLAAYEKKTIQAFEILGNSPLDPNATLTRKVLTVKELLAPLAREQLGIVRALGLNYADHAAEIKMSKPADPVLFYKPPQAIIGPTAPILIPRVAQPVKDHIPDYEVELTIVIGRPMKDIPESEALDYVVGYTGANDTSFRFHQMNTSQWNFSKGFDDATPIGPCIVAANTIKDPQNISLSCTLNGKVMQDGNTKNHLFPVAQTLALLSRGTTLPAGTIIMTGTPAGVGFGKKPPVYMKHGDTVRVWVGSGIGSCVNKVVEEGKTIAKL